MSTGTKIGVAAGTAAGATVGVATGLAYSTVVCVVDVVVSASFGMTVPAITAGSIIAAAPLAAIGAGVVVGLGVGAVSTVLISSAIKYLTKNDKDGKDTKK